MLRQTEPTQDTDKANFDPKTLKWEQCNWKPF